MYERRNLINWFGNSVTDMARAIAFYEQSDADIVTSGKPWMGRTGRIPVC